MKRIRRNHYLCAKVQPGEIKPMTADASRTLSQAEDLVAYGIRRGLMSYPAGTEFDQDGRPIPKLFAPEKTYTKPIEAYPCLRAWLMADNGSTHVQVAKAIGASTAKIGLIIAHGRELYRRQALETAINGGRAAAQSKPVLGGKASRRGPFLKQGLDQAMTTPGVGTLRPKTSKAGAKADRGGPERKSEAV